MSEHLRQSDLEDLSAWLDGELPSPRAAEVDRLVQENAEWARALQELRILSETLDCYEAPAPRAGLAQRILAGIPGRDLTDSEIEQLSAYVDGELPASAAAAVSGGIEADSAWRAAALDFSEIDSLLDSYTVPPAPQGLAERIIEAIHRRQRRRQVFRVGSWLAPAAAAALVLIGMAIFDGGQPPRPPGRMSQASLAPELNSSQAFQAVPETERPALQEEIIRNLNFFRDYEVVADMETLEAIGQLDEAQGT
jgi:anti-sigma factor RsiW